jgi:hypothetical protein
MFRHGVFVAVFVNTPVLIALATCIALILDFFFDIGMRFYGQNKQLNVPYGLIIIAAIFGAIPAALAAIFLELWLDSSKRLWWRDFLVGGLIGGLATLFCALLTNWLFSIENWLFPLGMGVYFGSFGTLIRLNFHRISKRASVP